MWSREELEQRIATAGIKGKCWGRFGRSAIDEIEQALEITLCTVLRDFGGNVGNLIVGPFSLLVCGSEDRVLSCVTETAVIRRSGNPYAKRLVKIMDHAGESYFGVSDSDAILCYDSINIAEGAETQSFSNLEQFVNWAFEEAKAIGMNKKI